MTRRAIIYARVSCEGQAGGYSLQSQIEGAFTFARETDRRVVGVYAEVGSGRARLPLLAYALRQIRRRRNTDLIAYMPDRIARGRHLVDAWEQVEDAGGEVLFTSEAAGRFVAALLEARERREAEQTAG